MPPAARAARMILRMDCLLFSSPPLRAAAASRRASSGRGGRPDIRRAACATKPLARRACQYCRLRLGRATLLLLENQRIRLGAEFLQRAVDVGDHPVRAADIEVLAEVDRKSTRLNSSHVKSRMPSSA